MAIASVIGGIAWLAGLAAFWFLHDVLPRVGLTSAAHLLLGIAVMAMSLGLLAAMPRTTWRPLAVAATIATAVSALGVIASLVGAILVGDGDLWFGVLDAELLTFTTWAAFATTAGLVALLVRGAPLGRWIVAVSGLAQGAAIYSLLTRTAPVGPPDLDRTAIVLGIMVVAFGVGWLLLGRSERLVETLRSRLGST